MPTFLIEFDSVRAALAYLSPAGGLNTAFKNTALISPAAQEYLQPAQPARDPDLMPPEPAVAVTLPPWKLLVKSSQQISGVTAQELAPSEERDLRTALAKFGAEVRERHKNPMIIRSSRGTLGWEQLLTGAARIASDYNFINPVIAENNRVTLAFVPLSVDPPSALHYAKVIEQLSSEFHHGLKIVACPREVTPYLRAPIRGRISVVIRVINNLLRGGGS